MGAFSRLRDYVLSWNGASVSTYPQWVQTYVERLFGTVAGFSTGPTYIAGYEDPPANTIPIYYPTQAVEKEGEIYVSSDLTPQLAWICQGVTWWPLGDGAAIPGATNGLFPKYEDDVEDAGLYREVVGQPFPTVITWYTNGGKTVKVKELLVTRNAQNLPLTVTNNFYTAGVVTKSYVDTITYTPGTVYEFSRSRVVAGIVPQVPTATLKYFDDADDTALYREITGQPFPTAIIWYTSNLKTTKVKELLITRNPNQSPAQYQWKFYVGGVLNKTYTDVVTYTGGTILEASRDRSVV